MFLAPLGKTIFTISRQVDLYFHEKIKNFFSLSLQINGDNNGHDEAFTDVKLEVPASTPTGDPTVSPKVTMIVQKIWNIPNTSMIFHDNILFF